jgi:hypothetical protein
VPSHNLWSFPVLAIPEMRNLAVSAAAAADMVILAVSGKDALPTAIKDWVEMWVWLIEDTHPALVALFERPDGATDSTRSYLRSVTAGKHLDFFPDCTFGNLPPPFSRTAVEPVTGVLPSGTRENEEAAPC